MSSKHSEKASTFGSIASPTVIYCSPDDSIPQVAKLMRDKWVDTIFVKDSANKIVGIITDGIIWDLVAREKDPREHKAHNIMYKPFISVKAEDPIFSIEEFRELIDKSKVKRVAVTKDGKIVGVVRKKFLERFRRYSRHFNVEFTQKNI
ncbi:MAG: CBS domain-containing protein [Candidatus Helarchaeota archaeon]|nr:CBS domain-containing protein [Candidatus Helarchaeota archaeon]